MLKKLWCLYFHKKYHTKYRDKGGGTALYFTIVECSKCNKQRITE